MPTISETIAEVRRLDAAATPVRLLRTTLRPSGIRIWDAGNGHTVAYATVAMDGCAFVQMRAAAPALADAVVARNRVICEMANMLERHADPEQFGLEFDGSE
jgi:hypothetical protein